MSSSSSSSSDTNVNDTHMTQWGPMPSLTADEIDALERARTTRVVTHSGQFHTDEVTAIAILELIYGTLEITRTRDNDTLNTVKKDNSVFVVDVGHEYSACHRNYDHHQTTFNDTYSDGYTVTPLSSCGLIFKHYGRELLEKLDFEKQLSANSYSRVLNYLYRAFVQPIDANDNGVDYLNLGQTTKYTPLCYGDIISKFNGDIYSDQDQASRFRSAVDYAKITITQYVRAAIAHQVQYDHELKEFNMDVVVNGHTLVLDKMFRNTESFLSRLDPEQNIKFIVFPVTDHEYRIWTRKYKGERFKVLVNLVSADQARSLVGDKLIFVHKGLFTGATRTLDSAIDLTIASVENHQLTIATNQSWLEWTYSLVTNLVDKVKS